MFAELGKIALTTAIPMESIFDVPSQSPLWESPYRALRRAVCTWDVSPPAMA